MNRKVFSVPPRSRKNIRYIAAEFRKIVNKPRGRFPIMDILEFILPKVDDKFEYEIRSIEEMGDNLGYTNPDKHRIVLRQDVYDRARAGSPRDRFTVAHEVGHYILHRDVQVNFARGLA